MKPTFRNRSEKPIEGHTVDFVGQQPMESVMIVFRHLERWLSGRKRQIANLL